jgi:NAD(P)-dependent dehydrogenase (short-subunit alcohol dehydrogenase family)
MSCGCCAAAAAAGRAYTKDGLEIHMQTNHLSHFLLTLGLLPALQRGAQQPPQQQQQQQQPASLSPPGAEPFRPRVVSVASAMHHFGYKFGPQDPLQKQAYSTTLAYGNSKLAQVRKNPGGMRL